MGRGPSGGIVTDCQLVRLVRFRSGVDLSEAASGAKWIESRGCRRIHTCNVD